jgi:hypothetical protein
MKEEGGGLWSFDDVVTVNTQTGSQWDGLRKSCFAEEQWLQRS